jgi:VanZ family protein
VLFAAAVEFAQLYAPDRTCAASDILAQGLGAAIGIAGWLAFGEWLTRLLADAPGGAAGRMLLGTVAAVGFVQLLPLDLSASPADVYRKLRDGGVNVVPFADPPGKNPTTGEDNPGWRRLVKWGQVVGLYLPVGLVAARLPRRLASPRTLGLGGFALAFVVEACQLLVKSRFPSTTDALLGGLGVTVGLVAGRIGRPWLGGAWLAGLVVVQWLPFRFATGPGTVEWVPLADLLRADYLHAADEIALKVILFVPLGALVGRKATAAVAAFAASALVEIGQAYLPDRGASLTDPLLAMLGAAIGAWAAQRLRAEGP